MIPNLSNHSISAARLPSRRFTPAQRAGRLVMDILASFVLLATCAAHAAAPMALTTEQVR